MPVPAMASTRQHVKDAATHEVSRRRKHLAREAVIALLNGADGQLADAEALGYGSYKPIHKEIASIKDKVSGGQSKPGLFDHIKQLFRKLDNSKAKS